MRAAAFAFLLLLLPAISHAQAIPGVSELSLTASPQYPRPYDQVTVTLDSSLIDLASANITIAVNGKTVATGERTATFAAGAAGAKSVVTATAVDTDGTHAATLTLVPEDVALIAEPTSTTHPFYLGAALPAPEGAIRLIAVPDIRTSAGARIPAASLAYTWKLGDQILETQSGIGKSVLQATAPFRYRDADISVTVATQDRTLSAQAFMTVSPSDPVLLAYPNDPLSGIDFAHAVGSTLALLGDEETFRAVPYYFANAPTLSWSLNGAGSGSDQNLTVRTTGASAGSALVGVEADGANGAQAAAHFTLQFGAAKSSGIFGL